MKRWAGVLVAASRVAAWLAFAIVVASVGSPALRAPPLRIPEAVAVGGLAGALLFAVLAGGLAEALAVPGRELPRAAARAVYFGARAAYEEALWRGTFLARLAGVVGAAPALALSTAGFAVSHARVHGRRAVSHLVTGSVFGGAYLATGRLGAAIAAHATYNALVGAALTGAVARSNEAGPPPAEAADVEKQFGSHKVLRGASLRVERGEIVALVGPNGAGKTTLVSILVGLRRPDRGTVRVCGGDPRRTRTRTLLGLTPQESAFPQTLRVREIVDLAGAHFPDPLSTADVLDGFALSTLGSRQTGGLSVGERRRLAVALAFAGRPRVVFLDEPTVGLDLEARQAVRRELRRFVAEGGSVLLTSHELHEVETLASRVAVLSGGRVVAEGSVAELRERAGLTRVTFHAAAVPSLPAVSDRVSEGSRHSVLTSEPERLVRALVTSGVPFSRLEVTPLALEEAFAEILRAEP